MSHGVIHQLFHLREKETTSISTKVSRGEREGEDERHVWGREYGGYSLESNSDTHPVQGSASMNVNAVSGS